MFKLILTITFLFVFTPIGKTQLLKGDLLTSGREIIKDVNPIINSTRYNGIIVFEITVNNDGLVTGAQIIEGKSDIISTPARLDAKKLVYSLVFKSGNQFPKYHTGIYQIVYMKK